MLVRKRKGSKAAADGANIPTAALGAGMGMAPQMGFGEQQAEAPDDEDEMSSAAGSILLSFLGVPEVLHHVVEGLETANKLGFGGFENALASGAAQAAQLAQAAIKNTNPAQQLKPNLAFMPAPKMGLSEWRQNRMGLALPTTGMTSSSSSSSRDDEEGRARRKKTLGSR